jgi:hypothetical protein
MPSQQSHVDESLASATAPLADGPNRRRHGRFLVQGEAEIIVRNGASLFRGRILNISESGCYIQTLAHVKLPTATQVDVLFVVSGKIITVPAEARTSTPKIGIGFQFMTMDRSMRALLKTILSSLDTEKSGPALTPFAPERLPKP